METIRKYGQSPFTIALLHGGPGAAGEMKPVAEILSGKRGVLEFLQTATSVDGQIEELKKQILSVTAEPLIIVGYSWGAWLATLLSARYPDRIKKLVLISSGAFDQKYNSDLLKVRLERLTDSERQEAENILSNLNTVEVNDAHFARFGELMTKADSYCLIDNKEDNVIIPNVEIYHKVWPEANELRRSGKLKEALSKIKCPITIIHGNYDPHPLDGILKPLEELGKNYNLMLLEKCGHTPWKEKYAKDKFYDCLNSI